MARQKEYNKQKAQTKTNVVPTAVIGTMPKSDGGDGRNKLGRFTEGNKLSLGNHSPRNPKAKEFKRALFAAVTEADIKDIAIMMVEKAKEGDVAAAKELFDRILGRALQTHEIDVEVKSYTVQEYDSIRALLARRCVSAREVQCKQLSSS